MKEASRRRRREKSRLTREDGTVYTKPPLAKRVERRLKRAGKHAKNVPNTRPLPAAVKEREAEKSRRREDKEA